MRRHHYKPYLGEHGTVIRPAPTTNGITARYENFSYSGSTWFDLTPVPANGVGTGFGGGVDWPRFDGAQWVTIGQPSKLALTGNMSFVAWSSQDSGTSGFERVMSRGAASPLIFSLKDSNGHPFILVKVSGAAKSIEGSSVINDGEWHMIAATYDGAKLKLYVDGALDAELVAAGTGQIDTVNDLYFGSNNGSSSLEGRIDTCRIYSRSLSAGEILNDYNAGKPAHP